MGRAFEAAIEWCFHACSSERAGCILTGRGRGCGSLISRGVTYARVSPASPRSRRRRLDAAPVLRLLCRLCPRRRRTRSPRRRLGQDGVRHGVPLRSSGWTPAQRRELPHDLQLPSRSRRHRTRSWPRRPQGHALRHDVHRRNQWARHGLLGLDLRFGERALQLQGDAGRFYTLRRADRRRRSAVRHDRPRRRARRWFAVQDDQVGDGEYRL